MENLKKTLINASNLHVGGGVQVATSIIGEITQIYPLPNGLSIWASSTVDTNLKKIGYDLSKLPSYEVVNSFGLRIIFSSIRGRLMKFNTVITIFGPLYVFNSKIISITGFAQPWIIYPNNEIQNNSNLIKRTVNKLKFFLQAKFFSSSDQLIVELEHVRQGLIRQKINKNSKIHVIQNCLSSIYLNPKNWESFPLENINNNLRIGFIGRNYAHKNTRIFPEIINILHQKHGIHCNIYVTFTDQEWNECDEVFRSLVFNVGPLFVAQCPNFYRAMNAIIFPSLLECFSATPLEAMAMERPLFASDRQFNHDICAEHAYYFDPMNPEDAAEKISSNIEYSPERIKRAREHALSFSNARERAKKYLDLLATSADNSE